jgi:hypothetical protein
VHNVKEFKPTYRPDREFTNERDQKFTVRYRTKKDMADALDWAMSTSSNRGEGASTKSGKWSGTREPAEYVTMLREGWKHGVEDVEGLEGLSSDAAEALEFYRDVGGVFPVVPAYLAGAPDNMLAVRPAPADRVRGLTLVIDSCFDAGVHQNTVLEYAQSVMRLVAWLQAEKVDVSVYSIVPIWFSQKRYVYVTPIRETGEILQPERIASVVHPSWLRRAWFAMIEREGYACDGKYPGSREAARHGGYGSITQATADEMRAILPEAFSVIMLPKVGRTDPAKAVQDAINLKLRRE